MLRATAAIGGGSPFPLDQTGFKVADAHEQMFFCIGAKRLHPIRIPVFADDELGMCVNVQGASAFSHKKNSRATK